MKTPNEPTAAELVSTALAMMTEEEKRHLSELRGRKLRENFNRLLEAADTLWAMANRFVEEGQRLAAELDAEEGDAAS